MIVVDRIEEGTAVLVIGDHRISLPLDLLPAGTTEGTALEFTIAPADAGSDEARLARLKATTPQNSSTYEL